MKVRDEDMKVRDEVCGMELAADQVVATTQFEGRTYYFCAERCKKLFQGRPHWYVPVGRNSSESE